MASTKAILPKEAAEIKYKVVPSESAPSLSQDLIQHQNSRYTGNAYSNEQVVPLLELEDENGSHHHRNSTLKKDILQSQESATVSNALQAPRLELEKIIRNHHQQNSSSSSSMLEVISHFRGNQETSLALTAPDITESTATASNNKDFSGEDIEQKSETSSIEEVKDIIFDGTSSIAENSRRFFKDDEVSLIDSSISRLDGHKMQLSDEKFLQMLLAQYQQEEKEAASSFHSGVDLTLRTDDGSIVTETVVADTVEAKSEASFSTNVDILVVKKRPSLKGRLVKIIKRLILICRRPTKQKDPPESTESEDDPMEEISFSTDEIIELTRSARSRKESFENYISNRSSTSDTGISFTDSDCPKASSMDNSMFTKESLETRRRLVTFDVGTQRSISLIYYISGNDIKVENFRSEWEEQASKSSCVDPDKNATESSSEAETAVQMANEGAIEVISTRKLNKISGNSKLDIAITHLQAGNYNKALTICERVVAKGSQSQKASCFNVMGVIYLASEDLDSALRYFKEAYFIRRHIFGTSAIELAYSLNNIGCVYFELDQLGHSMKANLEAIRIERLSQDAKNNDKGSHNLNLAASLCNCACVHLKRNSFGIAIKLFEEAYELEVAVLGSDHPSVWNIIENQGCALYRMSLFHLSLEKFSSLVMSQTSKLGHSHPVCSLSMFKLGCVYMKRNDHTSALHWFHQSISSYLNSADASSIQDHGALISVPRYILKELKFIAQLQRGASCASSFDSHKSEETRGSIEKASRTGRCADFRDLITILLKARSSQIVRELESLFLCNKIELTRSSTRRSYSIDTHDNGYTSPMSSFDSYNLSFEEKEQHRDGTDDDDDNDFYGTNDSNNWRQISYEDEIDEVFEGVYRLVVNMK